MTLPQGPNQRWSLDFVSDMLADGRRFRILVVVDDFTRECLGLSSTRGCRECGWRGNWTPSSRRAADR
jgi:transposase InsO family protein